MYIVLGPLTNLARMLRIDGAFVRERIGRVVIVGGEFDVSGNITASAECVSLLIPPISIC
jgi:inosine-uridine nucleoside N-ribohydrolase